MKHTDPGSDLSTMMNRKNVYKAPCHHSEGSFNPYQLLSNFTEHSEGLRWVCLSLTPDVKVFSKVPILETQAKKCYFTTNYTESAIWIAILGSGLNKM